MEEKEYLDLSVHEMKNILAAISGYSEFIYRGLVHGPKALEMAGKIKHMSDILAAYTDKKYMYDLLKADLYTPDRVWISLQEELENVRSDVQMKVHKKVNMELTCDGVDKLYGDKLLVRELFFALLENAAIPEAADEDRKSVADLVMEDHKGLSCYSIFAFFREHCPDRQRIYSFCIQIVKTLCVNLYGFVPLAFTGNPLRTVVKGESEA